ncbi:MAG: hypothetical protein K0R41_212 [Geminicoccaceae bacterium]|nr:hypothetical protein [Solirubrobacterales bacterium]MCE3246387.1 hypothetical protein [Geminicoccaceae bacterium]
MTGGGRAADRPALAYYCIADERYFLGAVGLVNSLRLLGHDEPVHLLDCGLTDAQRRLLEPQVALVSGASDTPPWLLKTAAPLERPAEVMVLLDTDLVVTRPLAGLIERAREGRVVAFRNPVDRFVAEWGELLNLGTARRQHYLSSAAICLDRALGTKVLGLMEARQHLVDFELTHWRQGPPDYPFTYADQDIFNAVLATRVEPDRIVALDQRLAPTPPFRDLSLVDERTLRCAYADAVEPYLVHHHVVKPWLEPTHHGVYSQLLRRLLIADDVAIRIPERQVPAHLRSGPRAYALRAQVNLRERLRWHVREPLGSLFRSSER